MFTTNNLKFLGQFRNKKVYSSFEWDFFLNNTLTFKKLNKI